MDTGSTPVASTIRILMKPFSKEYLEFETEHLAKLYELWYDHPSENLRQLILHARRVLEYLYVGAYQASTGRESTT